MVEISRRSALKGGLGMVAGAALGGAAQTLLAGAAGAATPPGFGPVPDLRDGVVRLWLAPGFQYRSFHDTEFPTTLGDGTLLPGRHDGMAAFPGGPGLVALVRNHEVAAPGPAFSATAPSYDPMAQGGTTSVLVDLQGNVIDSAASLVGTQMNCSGGPTPWNTWVTCEETVNGPDVGPDFTGVSNVPLTKPHGFIFEVPLGSPASAMPIRKAGRFAHESVAIDPHTGIVYLTEDDFGFPSGFYKYVPPQHPSETGWRIADGGTLYMLAVYEGRNRDMSAAAGSKKQFRVQWVRIDDPDPEFPYTPGQAAPTTNNEALTYVARQGWAQGAAYFSRLEGSIYNPHDRRIYFTSTQGGGAPESADISTPRATGYGKGTGQIWAYDTVTTRLHKVFESSGPDVLDFPDNITVSSNGRVLVCEDNVNDNYVRALTPGGTLLDVALNRLVSSTGVNRSNDEFAGATFSPDGSTLYVNIQASQGLSFAIWGPWADLGLA